MAVWRPALRTLRPRTPAWALGRGCPEPNVRCGDRLPTPAAEKCTPTAPGTAVRCPTPPRAPAGPCHAWNFACHFPIVLVLAFIPKGMSFSEGMSGTSNAHPSKQTHDCLSPGTVNSGGGGARVSELAPRSPYQHLAQGESGNHHSNS